MPTLLLLLATGLPAVPGDVVLPLDSWTSMRAQLRAYEEPRRPPRDVLAGQAALTGEFKGGVLHGELTYSFEVPAGVPEPIGVPFLGQEAVIDTVTLDGAGAAVWRQGRYFALPKVGPGRHTARARFFVGQGAERFARQVQLGLPHGSLLRVEVLVPESGIEPRLEGGVLASRQEAGGRTRLVGYLTGERLDLRWQRKLSHKAGAAFEGAYTLAALFALQQASASAQQRVELRVLGGETDRVDLIVPAGVEVVDVSGDAVLQWRVDKQEAGGRLVVFLRYLVSDSATFAVRFQQPVGKAGEATLRPLWPAATEDVSGALGVQAPVQLEVTTSGTTACSELPVRNLPAELTELTDKPLVAGYEIGGPAAAVTVQVKPHGDVPLTTTIIDTWDVSTVVLEDGTEISKLHLRVRNNTRQYLGVALPAGALLTHALLDGELVTPAVAEGGSHAIQVPLRQSERQSERWHTVQSGQTLSHIAAFYYSDPGQWRAILAANDLSSVYHVFPGRRLRIPYQGAGAAVEESSFVIELAYRRQHPALGAWGRLTLDLPAMDVEVVALSWRVYLPEVLEPLSFAGNVRQYSHVRYDLFRRAIGFLDLALATRRAWAGGKVLLRKSESPYSNILEQRRTIYRDEQRAQQRAEVLSDFPLVGQSFRFKRLFPGAEPPALAVSYLAADAQPLVRWAAFAGMIGLVLWLLLGGGSLRARSLAAAAGLAALLVVGHYVLGVHRRLLWGLDVALALWLVRQWLPHWRQRAAAWWRSPPPLTGLLSWAFLWRLGLFAVACAVVLRLPLLTSTFVAVAFLALTVRAWRARAAGVEEA